MIWRGMCVDHRPLHGLCSGLMALVLSYCLQISWVECDVSMSDWEREDIDAHINRWVMGLAPLSPIPVPPQSPDEAKRTLETPSTVESDIFVPETQSSVEEEPEPEIRAAKR